MQEKSNWKGIKRIEMICKTTKQQGRQITERRYYISSLPLNVKLFARTVRERCSVEIMHWHLDITFKEDINTTLKNDSTEPECHNQAMFIHIKTFRSGDENSAKKKHYYISMNVREYWKQILNQ